MTDSAHGMDHGGTAKYQVIGIHGRGGDGKMTRWTFEQDWKESPQRPIFPSSPVRA